MQRAVRISNSLLYLLVLTIILRINIEIFVKYLWVLIFGKVFFLANPENYFNRIVRDSTEEFMNEYFRRGLKILQKDMNSTRIRTLQFAHVSACTCIFWKNYHLAELCNFLPQVLQY